MSLGRQYGWWVTVSVDGRGPLYGWCERWGEALAWAAYYQGQGGGLYGCVVSICEVGQ